MFFLLQWYKPSRQYFIVNVSLVSSCSCSKIVLAYYLGNGTLDIEGQGLRWGQETFYEKVSRDMNDESDL